MDDEEKTIRSAPLADRREREGGYSSKGVVKRECTIIPKKCDISRSVMGAIALRGSTSS